MTFSSCLRAKRGGGVSLVLFPWGMIVSDEISILCEIELTNNGIKDLKMEIIEDKNVVLSTMYKQKHDNDIVSD